MKKFKTIARHIALAELKTMRNGLEGNAVFDYMTDWIIGARENEKIPKFEIEDNLRVRNLTAEGISDDEIIRQLKMDDPIEQGRRFRETVDIHNQGLDADLVMRTLDRTARRMRKKVPLTIAELIMYQTVIIWHAFRNE